MPDQDHARTPATPRPVPERFLVARRTLYFDRIMTSAIAFGGIGVVIAVLGIFAFILAEILPLFQLAQIRPAHETRLDLGGTPAVLGLDEWSELPFLYDRGARFIFRPAGKGASQPVEQTIPLPEGAAVSCHAYDSESQRMILGTSTGLAGHV